MHTCMAAVAGRVEPNTRHRDMYCIAMRLAAILAQHWSSGWGQRLLRMCTSTGPCHKVGCRAGDAGAGQADMVRMSSTGAEALEPHSGLS